MKVKIDIAPSGPGCRHVNILDPDTNRILEVMTLDDWDDVASSEDSPLRASIKQHVRQIKTGRLNMANAAIKVQLEAIDLWV